jgi:hypothetical protein
MKYWKIAYELRKTYFIYTDMRKFVWLAEYLCVMYLAWSALYIASLYFRMRIIFLIDDS